MTQPGDTDDTHHLDVRDIDGAPFEPIVAAIQGLSSTEELTLITRFEPVPLYDELDQRGYSYRTQQVQADQWRIQITPREP